MASNGNGRGTTQPTTGTTTATTTGTTTASATGTTTGTGKRDGSWRAGDMPDQSGRVAIVTGANSGIGYETARALAAHGACVVMACRSADKMAAAADAIRAEAPSGTVETSVLDLSNLDSVRSFATDFLGRHDRLDLLVNNAGVMALPERRETTDGFEMQFGTNHLGHFALTGLLLGRMLDTPGSRVVNVSSSAHRFGSMDFDDLQGEQSYKPRGAYGQSKLANLLFTFELQRRLDAAGSDCTAVAAHPGWTATNLQQHSRMVRMLNPILSQTPEMGALPTLYAAAAEDVHGAEYFGPDGWFEMRGGPTLVSSTDKSHDRADAARLWQLSEELTGVTFPVLDDVGEAVASAPQSTVSG